MNTTHRRVYGPYDTPEATYGEPMPERVKEIFGSKRGGDWVRAVRDARLEALLAVCRGVELGAYDAKTLAWLTEWEDSLVQVLIGVISRVAATAGRETAEEIARALGEPPALSNAEIADLARVDGDEDRSAAVVGVALGYAAGVARRVGGA